MSGAATTIAVNIITATTTLGLTWFVGGRITERWDRVKKVHELDLAAANAMYAAYGRFYGIWKQWSVCLSGAVTAADRASTRSELLRQAASAEAEVEALLLKIAVERRLDDDQQKLLGCFRQAFQTLRESITDDRRVGMPRGRAHGGESDESKVEIWSNSEVYSYRVFKALVVWTATLVATPGRRPTAAGARQSILEITRNRYEPPVWAREAGERLRLDQAIPGGPPSFPGSDRRM